MASPVEVAPPPRLRRVVRSFGYAFEGLATMLRTQPNFLVHISLAVLALVLGVVLRLSPTELAILVLTIAMVLVLECLNTALESLSDVVSPTYQPLIKRAKDVAAAAVLISAVASLLIAALLFVPRL